MCALFVCEVEEEGVSREVCAYGIHGVEKKKLKRRCREEGFEHQASEKTGIPIRSEGSLRGDCMLVIPESYIRRAGGD